MCPITCAIVIIRAMNITRRHTVLPFRGSWNISKGMKPINFGKMRSGKNGFRQREKREDAMSDDSRLLAFAVL